MNASKQLDTPVVINIDDLEETVGGSTLRVTSINQSVATSKVNPGSVFYDPDTCPTSPGTPASTCMCPGVSGFGVPNIRTLPGNGL